MLEPPLHIRLARPSRDLASAERFYVDGLGLEVLYRASGSAPGEHDIVMLGQRGAAWHLELVHDPVAPIEPTPSVEDLLVLYLGTPVDEELVDRLIEAGGHRVTAHNPYWDRYGVTIEDPDGYRIVLCTRSWTGSS